MPSLSQMNIPVLVICIFFVLWLSVNAELEGFNGSREKLDKNINSGILRGFAVGFVGGGGVAGGIGTGLMFGVINPIVEHFV